MYLGLVALSLVGFAAAQEGAESLGLSSKNQNPVKKYEDWE